MQLKLLWLRDSSVSASRKKQCESSVARRAATSFSSEEKDPRLYANLKEPNACRQRLLRSEIRLRHEQNSCVTNHLFQPPSHYEPLVQGLSCDAAASGMERVSSAGRADELSLSLSSEAHCPPVSPPLLLFLVLLPLSLSLTEKASEATRPTPGQESRELFGVCVCVCVCACVCCFFFALGVFGVSLPSLFAALGTPCRLQAESVA